MTSSQLKFTCTFADKATRVVTIGPIQTASLSSSLKQDIIDFNDPTQRAVKYPNFDTAFVSDMTGADFVRISKAQVVTTEKIILS